MFDVPTPKIPFREKLFETWEIGYSVPQVHRAVFEPARQKLPDAAMSLQFVFADDPAPISHSFCGVFSPMPDDHSFPQPAETGKILVGNVIDILFNAGTTWFLSLFLDWRSLRIHHRLVRLYRPREGDLSVCVDLLPPMPEPRDEIVEAGEVPMDRQYLITANAIIDRILARVALSP